MSNTATKTRESRVNLPVYPSDPNLSSHSYLLVRLRFEPGMKPSKLRIHSPKICNHSHAICEECVDSWSWDYHIDFGRTVGGRKILARGLELEKEIDQT
jgi:hypothetical protein